MRQLISGGTVPMSRAMLVAVLVVLVQACSLYPERSPVPVESMGRATPLPGIPAVRAWSGSFSEQFADDLLSAFRDDMRREGEDGRDVSQQFDILSLSGGADDGAFGAGFLNGWSQAGTRPVFKVVTGISAGALIAPFAFLGSDFDDELKEAFTHSRAKDIYKLRGISALWSDALTDSEPLRKLIGKYFNAELLQEIARQHRQGRRLYIGTTNLDADRLVVWNMGAIADSGHSDAPALFQQIILASSSIPVVFPPVLIQVDLDGKRYDEMHVDGGVKAQLFLTAATIDVAKLRERFGTMVRERPKSHLYVIRNAKVGPVPKPTARKLNEISRRSMSALIKSQARSDLDRLYTTAASEGIDFNWVAIPAEFTPANTMSFDRAEMNRLFQIGYDLGQQGQPWRNQPPAFGRR